MMHVLEVQDTSMGGRYGLVQDSNGQRSLWFAASRGERPHRLCSVKPGATLAELCSMHSEALHVRKLSNAEVEQMKRGVGIREKVRAVRARFHEMLRPNDPMVGWWAHKVDPEE